jgi:hypothetical protein
MATELGQEKGWTVRLLLVAFLILAVATVALIGLLNLQSGTDPRSLPEEKEIDFGDRFKLIKAGMTLDDAIRIMGCPPGVYQSPNKPKPTWGALFMPTNPGKLIGWTDDKRQYYIVVDDDEKIVDIKYLGPRIP